MYTNITEIEMNNSNIDAIMQISLNAHSPNISTHFFLFSFMPSTSARLQKDKTNERSECDEFIVCMTCLQQRRKVITLSFLNCAI